MRSPTVFELLLCEGCVHDLLLSVIDAVSDARILLCGLPVIGSGVWRCQDRNRGRAGASIVMRCIRASVGTAKLVVRAALAGSSFPSFFPGEGLKNFARPVTGLGKRQSLDDRSIDAEGRLERMLRVHRHTDLALGTVRKAYCRPAAKAIYRIHLYRAKTTHAPELSFRLQPAAGEDLHRRDHSVMEEDFTMVECFDFGSSA
jgi:hypothetical protein